MRDTWEGLKIVWRREPHMIVAWVGGLIAVLAFIAERLYSLVR